MFVQGLPGVGNLTQCKYEVRAHGTAALQADPTLTPWVPATVEESKA